MRTLCAVVGLLLLFSVSLSAAGAQEDARSILEKAIQAHGGAEKLSKVKGQAWKAKGTMTAAGTTMAYTADYTFMSPDKFRFDLRMDTGGQQMALTAGSDGKIAWEQMGQMLRDMPKEKRAEFHHSAYVMYLSQLTPLQNKAFTLTSLGESKLGDRTLVGINVSHPDRRDVSLYFDKKTGLLAKTGTRVFDEFLKKEVAQDNLLAVYRGKEGRKIFDKLTIQRDGKDFIVEELSGQQVLEKVDGKQFTKPAPEK